MHTEDIVGEYAIERWKAVLDYLKHITTVSSAISLICIALYKDIAVVEFQYVLLIAIGLFVASAGAAVLTHLIFLMPNFENSNRVKLEKDAGLGLLITVLCAFFGFACLLLYVSLSLYVKN